MYRNGFETYSEASQEALLAAFSGKVTFISPAVPSGDETKQGLPKVL
ncbi:MAG: hypothetical protein P1U32_07290 [Legionellaceae bacterium]|nr:hypothetical protein [Legionellaceae bacterium]